jgi:hypothetical protein
VIDKIVFLIFHPLHVSVRNDHLQKDFINMYGNYYYSVTEKRYKIYIYEIVIIVSIHVVKILLKMVVSDRNM